MSVPKRIFWTTLGMGGVAVGTMVALLLWITAMTDVVAATETHKRVEAAVQREIDQNALLTIDYAHWTSAWEWYRDGNEEALYENLGSGAADSESFDLIYILHADGTPTHVYVNEEYASDLSYFDAKVASDVLEAFGTPELQPYSVVSGLTLIEDAVAVVAAGRIQPDDITGLSTGDLPIIIGASWMDAEALSEALFLPSFGLTALGDTSIGDRSSIILTGLDGAALRELRWTAPRPGRALLISVAPAVGLLAVLIGVGSLIVGRVSAQQTADYLRERVSARTDPDTGLLNRSGLREITESPIMQTHFARGEVAMIYVDLNGLKHLNDAHGHRVGDAAIVATGQRLQAAARKSDRVARIGGDEFVCLIIDDDARGAAERVANRVAKLTAQDFSYENKTYPTGAAIGIATSTQAKTWDGLLSQADQAMYQAKRDDLGRPVLFGTELPLAG